MVEDTTTYDDKQKKDLADIRKEVRSRINTEALAYPDVGTNNGKVSSPFVRQCLYASELGDGLLYAALLKDRYVYNNTAKEWLKWGGHNWERDIMETSLASTEVVVDRLIEEAGHVAEDIAWNTKKGDKKRVKELQKTQAVIYGRITRFRTDKGRNLALKFARTNNDPLAIRGDEMDLHPWLLPCKNGILDLKTGIFRDGRPDEYMFLASPTEWKDLKEPCPRWEKFLFEIFEEKQEMVDYIQRLLGYAITGLNIEHIFPVFWGPGGRNGKGKIVEAMNFVLGDLSGAIQSEMLLDQKRPRSSQGPSPDILTLKGLRMAFASETDEGQRFSAAKVKWLTGGDQLVGRYPHDKYNLRFEPTHSLFLLTNRKPMAPGDDFAFWERMHLIPFRLRYVDREPAEENERRADKYLGDKLKKEASGILAWLVRGCLEYQKQGLKPPKEILEATAEYRRDEDILADWLEDYCDIGPDEKGQASDLHDHFVKWFRKNVSKKKDFSQRRFGTLMGRRFEKSKAVGITYYTGVDLNPAAPPINDD
ncbi:MAG: DNA primase [Deltaproteobacteria bacterium]|nr:DNA primase [Deltaproteobacteria bacterium]